MAESSHGCLQPFTPIFLPTVIVRESTSSIKIFKAKTKTTVFGETGWALDYDIKTLLALIFADNLASQKLFKKLGFKEWGES